MTESDPLRLALERVMEARFTLTRPEAAATLAAILGLADPSGDPRIAALLGAMAARGETEEELAGFVDTLRARSLKLPLTEAERAGLVDTCGTGGDASGTFNISTAAALVAAAAGAVVAKHGNRAVTSKCGSGDVLEAFGIRVDHTPDSAAAALRAHRFAFLLAPALQPAIKAVLPLRRALGVRTAFNLLGPMTNPAGAPAQVMGVYSPKVVATVAATLAKLGTRHAYVVHGGGMDEFSLCGPTLVGEVIGDEFQVGQVTPADFGLPEAKLEALAGGDAAANAAILRAIFAGQKGAPRDVVVMNAAAVLVTAELAEDFFGGARLAEAAIDAGKVAALVGALAQD